MRTNIAERVRRLLRLGLLAGLVMGALPAQAMCVASTDGPPPMFQPGAAQLVLAHADGRSVLSVLPAERGQAQDFMLILPVASLPGPDQLRLLERELLLRLDLYDRPALRFEADADPCVFALPLDGAYLPEAPQPPQSELADQHCPPAYPALLPRVEPAAAQLPALPRSNAEQGVSLAATLNIGPYEVLTLNAQSAEGLAAWLRELGYPLPADAAAVLAPALARGMHVVVARLQGAQGDGRSRPALQLSYTSAEPGLPSGLSRWGAGGGGGLTLHVLTREGPVSGRPAVPGKPLRELHWPLAAAPLAAQAYEAMLARQLARTGRAWLHTEAQLGPRGCDAACQAERPDLASWQQLGATWVKPERPGAAAGPWLTRLQLRAGAAADADADALRLVPAAAQAPWRVKLRFRQPFPGRVAACMAGTDCARLCQARVPEQLPLPPVQLGPLPLSHRNRAAMQTQCEAQCQPRLQASRQQAEAYYRRELPRREARLWAELARQTGWSRAQLEAASAGDALP